MRELSMKKISVKIAEYVNLGRLFRAIRHMWRNNK